MRNSRSIHLLIGGLFLWSLAPFPFLYVVLPPFWMVAGGVALWRIVRPEVEWRPSMTVLNLIGIMVLLAVIVAGGFQVGPLRPLGHLLLLLTAIRVATVNELKDVQRALPAIFLAGLVGVVSAVHVSIVPYLFASLALWWYVGMQVFLFELSWESGEDLGRPRWSHVVAAAVVVAILAIPFFMVLPRLTSPLVGSALHRESGFSEKMDLGMSGEISESEIPALTVSAPDGRSIPAGWLRLRAGAYDQLDGGTWAPRKTGLSSPVLKDGLVWLDPDRQSVDGLRSVEIRLEDRERFLFVPPNTVALEIDQSVLLDPSGGIVLETRHGPVPRYRVWLAPDSVSRMDQPQRRDLRLRHPDLQTAMLASQIAGDVSGARAKATAIENHLSTNYTYSLAGGVRGSKDPVSWFLFSSRKGHCEFFAAAMVVLLRHENVPARLVVGYHGGDATAGGDRVIVRRSNAHTWVEAWLGDDRGWVVFDPTPAEGIDGLIRLGLLDRGRLVWKSMEDFFDRRILTFGLGEQIGVLMAAGDAMVRSADWFLQAFRWWWLGIVGGVISLIVALPALKRRVSGVRRPPAARMIDRMAGRLKRQGIEVPESVTVGWIGRQSAKRWPAASRDIQRLVAIAEDELYGVDRFGRDHVKAVRLAWRKVRRFSDTPPTGFRGEARGY